MKLYIVRHGDAVETGEGGITRDEDRTLSRDGRKTMAEVAKGMAGLGWRPDRVGTSPLARAEETARILADEACPGASFEVCDFLAPGATAAAVLAWLAREAGEEAVIVGHLPDTARIASELLSGGEGVDLVFKKGAVCCISFDGEPQAGKGRLEWLLQPRALKAAAKACRGGKGAEA